jgi:hypothetical protein
MNSSRLVKYLKVVSIRSTKIMDKKRHKTNFTIYQV